MAHYDGFKESADEAYVREHKDKPTPNRLKFASLVGKLNPLQPDYSQRVMALNSEYNQREELITRLCNAFEPDEQAYADLEALEVNGVRIAVRAAVERWVVDNR